MNTIDSKKISSISAALIVVALLLGVFLLTQSASVMKKVGTGIWMAALLFGLVYALKGYTKKAANFYTVFYAFSIISVVVDILICIVDAADAGFFEKYVPAILSLVFLVCLGLLGFMKDFGKEKSTATAYVALAASGASLVVACIIGHSDLFISAFARLVMAFMICIFVFCKYADKAERKIKISEKF